MGYMGLDNVGDSDEAADLAYVAINKMVAELQKGLKEKANEYNTSGPVNVALFFEAFILPAIEEYKFHSSVWDLARDAKDALKKHRDWSNGIDWDGDIKNKNMHIKAYDRMLKSLDKFLNSKS